MFLPARVLPGRVGAVAAGRGGPWVSSRSGERGAGLPWCPPDRASGRAHLGSSRCGGGAVPSAGHRLSGCRRSRGPRRTRRDGEPAGVRDRRRPAVSPKLRDRRGGSAGQRPSLHDPAIVAHVRGGGSPDRGQHSPPASHGSLGGSGHREDHAAADLGRRCGLVSRAGAARRRGARSDDSARGSAAPRAPRRSPIKSGGC